MTKQKPVTKKKVVSNIAKSPTVIDAVPAIRLETGEILSTREHYAQHVAAIVSPTAATPVHQEEEHDGTA